MIGEEGKMIKEKYKQLCLYRQFGGIYTIEYTQSLGVMREKQLWITKKNIYM